MNFYSSAPRLAVIVPVFRHSSLLIEAIESVLAQSYDKGLCLLLVNDGCSFQETEEVCVTYAMAYPQIITYLRKANGGLSDARNCGICHVLEHLPSVEALYMLDADNRLQSDSMARAMAALDSDPDVDWIYPNIDMFGVEQDWDYGGDYSLLVHSAMNICEAGSLIRRRVFASGVLFDTGFKMGWEDWDFFLSAASQGFRGKNIENFGFRYRKRPESMLADSSRDFAALSSAMQQKHKMLYRPRNLIVLEQAEAPRYAIHFVDRDEILRCVDPDAGELGRLDFATFEQEFWNSQISQGRHRTPPFNIVLSSGIFEGLRDAGLLHWVLWKLETICETQAIGVLIASMSMDDRFSASIVPQIGNIFIHPDAIAVAMTSKTLTKLDRDLLLQSNDRDVNLNTHPKITVLELRLPKAVANLTNPEGPTAIHGALALVNKLCVSKWREAAGRNWAHRNIGIPFRGREHEIVRRPFGNAPVFPRVPDGRLHVGFILPLVEFGGVEKVAQQMARGLRSHGWVPHAFVLGSSDIAFTPDWGEVFESTNLLADPEFVAWGGGSQEYFGTNVPQWAQSGRHGQVLGMLHWLDAAINFHSGAAVGIMGQLRRMGVTTLNSLHLLDLTPLGRPVGNPYLGLAYEHAFDYFLPCSHQLGDWLSGMGVPRDKIVPVPNAPGFEIDPVVLSQVTEARMTRDPKQSLRVMYLGRLDRQKGLDRLAEVIRQSNAEQLNIIWRVLGKTVVAGEAPPIPPDVAALLEPPVFRASELAAAYAWADVVVLLSRYEGLPLTVLEAMRAGVVVIATDVGATAEVVSDGETGILVPDLTAAADCLQALRILSQDRNSLAAISKNAYNKSRNRDWRTVTEELAKTLKPRTDKIEQMSKKTT